MSARETALLTLNAMERRKAWSSGQLQKSIRDGNLDRRDAALATQLCFGVLQNRLLLDFYLQQYSSMKLEKMNGSVRNNLRIGLYQMLFLSKIPASAAVSEAVELTKKHSKNPRAAGMVNGILRNLARHLDELPALDRSNQTSYLSTLYSHPAWMVKELSKRLDEKELEALLRWDNSEPPVTVQVNTCKCTAAEVTVSLTGEGVTVQPHPWLSDCLLLAGTGDLTRRTAFQEGMFYAQDPAARLAVLAAGLKEGDRVLDACAAPGGKSFAAAMVMGDRGEITACDIYTHKKALMQAGADRLGLNSVKPFIMDSTKRREKWVDSFDAVIADVPCSGLGVMRKKPEIRFKERGELDSLPPLQEKILDTVSAYVRPGGVLLYSTCTLRKAENEDRMTAFLEKHPDFRLEGFSLPDPIGEVSEGYVTLWPQRTDTDGFFVARLRRGEGTK